LAALLAGCAPSHEQQVAKHTATISKFCLDCHNDNDKTGGLSLEKRSLADVRADAAVWEQALRKLGSGMMPPRDGGKRPDPATYADIIHWLSTELDRGYKPHFPAPGAHRMNRAEYANAVRDLTGIEVDAAQFLPSDDSSRGFDNQAGALAFSPALLEAYLSAAGKISRMALGDIDSPVQTTYRVATDTTQNYHVEGLPFGTRGGLLVSHYFPVDGEYTFKVFSVNLGNMGNFRPFGEVRGEQLQVIVDDAPVAQFDWDKEFGVNRGFGFSGDLKTIDVKLPVSAGPHKIGVTFLATDYAPLLDLNNAFERSTIETGGLPGFTFYPHIGSVRVDGPFVVKTAAQGAAHSVARERIFVCHPENAADEPGCAQKIVSALTRRAFRGQQTERDVQKVLDFYARGREQSGSFDAGVEMALQRVLVDTKFIYRLEAEPANVAEGESYALSDLELASRLSFFLWSSIPDDELLTLAEQGKLHEPAVLATQTKRLLADPRSAAFTKNFAGQWLSLRNLGRLHVRERSAREALRHSRRAGQRVPARDARARARSAPRPARQGQHPDDLVAAGAHGARDPRQLGHVDAARRTGPAAATERAEARGQESGRGRQRARAHAARAVRRAPQESDVRRVSRADGSVRFRARAVRCGGSLPHARRHVADQSFGHDVRRHRFEWPDAAAQLGA
jgi:hypothetical protein